MSGLCQTRVFGAANIIRGARITVADILDYLAGDTSPSDIVADFPDLHDEDIRAALAFAADRERRLFTSLFDENLSFRLVEQLADGYPRSFHVRNVGLTGRMRRSGVMLRGTTALS